MHDPIPEYARPYAEAAALAVQIAIEAGSEELALSLYRDLLPHMLVRGTGDRKKAAPAPAPETFLNQLAHLPQDGPF